MWRSLASVDAECPLLVKKASDTLAELLKEPKSYDNITKDFKYGGRTFLLHSSVHSGFIFLNCCNITFVKVKHRRAPFLDLHTGRKVSGGRIIELKRQLPSFTQSSTVLSMNASLAYFKLFEPVSVMNEGD